MAQAHRLPGMLSLAVALVAVASCGQTGRQGPGPDDYTTAPPEIISSHTSGPISVESRILIQFVAEIAARDAVGTPLGRGALLVSPALPGDLVWADPRTIEIKPTQPLPRGRKYTVRVFPQKIDPTRFDATSEFSFSFSVMTQEISLAIDGYRSAESDNIHELVLAGTLRTADIADPAAVEKTLDATLDGDAAPIQWTHTRLEHRFLIPGIVKQESLRLLRLAVDGSPVGARLKDTVTQEVPIRTVFRVLQARAMETPERYVEVSFSDPLLATQDYRGFVAVTPGRGLRYTAQGNILKVYSLTEWGDDVRLTVRSGIRNAASAPLETDATFDLSFRAVLPAVRYVGNGVVVPYKEGITVPIETVNVNAAIVQIERVYAANIAQFLQVNELSGGNEIRRVGRTVWKKVVPIPYTVERRNQWIRTALDLSPLVAADRHSLYRITLSFDVRHIEYPGGEVPEEDLLAFDLEDLELSEPGNVRVLAAAFWEQYRNSRDEDRRPPGNYYDNRRNPRHPAYYRDYYYDSTGRNTRVSRNFLVSDLGIIAQRDANGRLTIAVSNLLTAAPVANATVSLLDYQLQKLAEVRTDASGLAAAAPAGDAYLVVAETGGTRGYLRLEGASNLPVSHFDVAGQVVQQGIKGFLYGERGVWRPGDPIYLTFVLEDKAGVLPGGHPVILSLYDPAGRLVKTLRKTDPVGSFYVFTLETSPDAPTGAYLAKVTVGGVSFSKTLSVETIKPNRLAIGIRVGDDAPELTTQPTPVALDVRWLHGAVAGNMKTEVAVQLTSLPTSFPDYRGYTFDDPVRTFRAESKEVYTGTLDESGRAGFVLGLAAQAIAPGKLRAAFRTRVFEPGGSINVDTFTTPFHPYTRYAGLRIPDAETGHGWLDVDQPHPVQVALVDPTGKPVTGSVQVDVYEIGWRWWWDREDDNIADYLGTKDYRLVTSQTVSVRGGAASWTLSFRERVWGRYLIRVRDADGGHATGQIVYLRWPGWYYTSPADGGDSASMLVFSADKESYTVGQTARITLPTADRGRALVSIENNGALISTSWIETQAGQTIHEIALTERMTPNIYVHVSHVQPHGQTVNDRPIRMFGIIPLAVEDPATRLQPRVETAPTFEPNSTATITVRESTGRPMTYTLAVVDQGLLSLTRFATPDAWAHFYRRDALAVSTYDMYGFVAAAYGGTLERLLAVGGGDDGFGAEGRKADRFPPMVRFLGPFTLDRGKTQTHTVDIPQYVGAVRVMAVAGQGGAYGYAEQEVPVKKPVMVYATLPRVVSVTERFALPVSVFVLEEGIRSVDVRVSATGGIQLAGQAEKTVPFARTGEQLVTFDLSAATRPGLATVRVTATAGRISSSQTIEMDVRVPNPEVTTTDDLLLGKGETRSVSVALPGLAGTNTVVLEVSRIAPMDLEGRLTYLIDYPHGCIEQTTSAVFPQLYLDRVTDLDPAAAADVRRNIQAGIDRLQHFQTSGGGFGFWPGDREASSYGTAYATHFLLEAEKVGYVVPNAVKRGALGFLKAQVGRWAWRVDRSDFVQAYALYDLALAGEPDLGAMNRMRERRDLPAEVRFKLAAAYAHAGQKEEALRLTQGAIPRFSPYSELGGTYGSDLRDTAILAEGFLEAGLQDQAATLINEISKRLSTGVWYSTQTTAYSLLVIGKYLGARGAGTPLAASYTWNGRRETVQSSAPVRRVPLALADESTAQALRVTNDTQEPIYVRVVKTGHPALGQETARSNGLALTMRYYDKNNAPLDVGSLPQGADVVVEIAVKNPTVRAYEELALTYVAPAGWEISNPRFEGWTQDSEKGFEYQDVRDDRVLTYFDLGAGSTKTLKLMLNASYLGTFYLPQSKVEAMYDAAINAAGEGRWITVRAEDAPAR